MATTLLDVRKIKRPWRLICIAEKLFSHSGMQHTWGILRKCVLIKLRSFHGQIGSCIAVTYADSRATEHLVSISSGIVFAAEMASTMVESHGLKWLSPRTCVLEKWCHLSESNEALSWFNQSSLSEKEVERKSRGKGREGGGGIYSEGDEFHVMGLFLANTSLIYMQFRNLLRESWQVVRSD